MRIAIVNWTRRRVGGAETYLNNIIPELHRHGHSVAFWYEVDDPQNRESIEMEASMPEWSVASMGHRAALEELTDWHPDIIFVHGLLSPILESEIVRIAPAVLLAHAYYGTCISGSKTFMWPVEIPCNRKLGWQCLLHYYPHRCGGWNPAVMLSDYKRQSRRLELLKSYGAILTLSEYMRSEYLRHGFCRDRVFNLSRYSVPPAASLAQALQVETSPMDLQERPIGRLLFLGRMELLKGGHLLLDSLSQVKAVVGRPLHLTFAGEGPARSAWERQAARLQTKDRDIRVNFVGWLNGHQIEQVLSDSDLLIVPSLWPEPFGLVGPLAGSKGIPSAAFNVGGITEWLIDGINGHLAPGNPATADGLAQAIIKCIQDPSYYRSLRSGAKNVSRQFQVRNHALCLIELLSRVIKDFAKASSPGHS
jgi:glycosyltransferase involved in cell wall biosynthesis